MTDQTGPPGAGAVTFGPFRLIADRRLLERDGRPVRLGARALDLLDCLVRNAGRTVGKEELLAQVWPDVFVDEGALRFHVAALRKALGDGQDGARYIETLPGRGYCFVGSLSGPGPMKPPANVGRPGSGAVAHNLPAPLVRTIGRDEILGALAAQVTAHRFVSIVGPGGIGKTTVAISVGHALLQAFEGHVRFADLGPVGDAALLAGAVGSALGLAVQTADPIAGVIAFLRDRRMLLILDSCEHVIETAALIAERIHAQAPLVHLLVTSREALRAEGERIHQLVPLASPAEPETLTASAALAFPAVQLFVERVAAGESAFELTDAEAPIVAEICRSLDGVALAIELAAGRVGAYGVAGTARLLEGEFRLRWPGRRTAPPRQQTLAATLDWSHALLSEAERIALRRFAAFAGMFSLDAARMVAADDGMDSGRVLEATVGLVAKSLIAVVPNRSPRCFRLLDTTRAYALGKLLESGEQDRVARRHAAYFRDFLEASNADAFELSRAQAFALYGEHVANVRLALEWSFGERGDAELGTELAAAAALPFLRLSLLTECHRWTERAIAGLDAASRGTQREMRLQASLGQSLMFTRGNSEQARAAYERGLLIAEACDDLEHQVQLLGGLHIFHERIGDHHRSLAKAQQCEAAALRLGHPTAIAAARSFLGITCHLMGRNDAAQEHLEAGLVAAPLHPKPPPLAIHFGFDHRNRTSIALARTLWLRGYADQAVRTANQTVAEAAGIDHPVTRCIALIWAVSVHLWTGDLASAEASIGSFIEHAERYALIPYYAVGAGVRGELALRSGHPREGVALLHDALAALHQDRYELLTTAFDLAIAEGLVAMREPEEALRTLDRAITRGTRDGDLFMMPELLRIRGEVLAERDGADPRDAEAVLSRALDLASSQQALAWELRVGTSLARLHARQGRAEAAREVLAPILGRFTEGFGTVDLLAAKRVLDALERGTALRRSS